MVWRWLATKATCISNLQKDGCSSAQSLEKKSSREGRSKQPCRRTIGRRSEVLFAGCGPSRATERVFERLNGKGKEPRRLCEGNVMPTSDMHFNEDLIYTQEVGAKDVHRRFKAQ